MKHIFCLLLSCLCAFVACTSSPTPPTPKGEEQGWPSYGGDPGGQKYSPLTEINRDTVKHLEIAWVYRTGESPMGLEHATLSECTPLLVDGVLYICTPLNQVIALNPASGKELWRFDPKVPNQHYANGPTCRGVSIWKDPTAPFHKILFIGTNDGRLIAIDTSSGKPVTHFGQSGEVNLKVGMGERGTGNYQITSPPALIGELVIVGSAINDNAYQEEAKGTVRAYHVRTGELKWSWDPIPTNPNDPAYQTWQKGSANRTGAANVWSIISVDPARDLVFLPTSSPSVDYYGGERLGKNLHANSVVALRGTTGELVWSFQAVHHDIWDYDIPAQPTLVELTIDGQKVPALIQGTKMGHLFVLHRETGKPLFSIEERPVPQDAVAGEQPWPTQPFPLTPPPIVPQSLTKETLFGINAEEQLWAQAKFENLHYEGIFTPGSEKGTLVFPGNIGGVAWGGVSFDPEEEVAIVNTNRLAAIIQLLPRAVAEQNLPDKKPSSDVGPRDISNTEKAPMRGTPYVLRRSYFVSPKGIPCNPPPWGALAAIRIKDGVKKWEVPLGIYQGLQSVPEAKKWGSPNYGGALVTRGGLIFIAATMDDTLRAFDKDTGQLLWESPLPAGAQATPMTYRLSENGKQYVLINAGGHGRLKTTPGDYFIAFTLKGNL